MTYECFFCSAKHFLKEMVEVGKFSNCCKKEKLILPVYYLTLFLQDLMACKHGAQIKAPPGYGPYCFRIDGQIYHRALTLHPAAGVTRKYAKLYEATEKRLKICGDTECDKSVMKDLKKDIHRNPLVKAQKMLYEVEMEAENEARERGIRILSVTMATKHDRSLDNRRYNAQRVYEVHSCNILKYGRRTST